MMNCNAIYAEIQGNNNRINELGREKGWKTAQNVAAGVGGLVVPVLWFAWTGRGRPALRRPTVLPRCACRSKTLRQCSTQSLKIQSQFTMNALAVSFYWDCATSSCLISNRCGLSDNCAAQSVPRPFTCQAMLPSSVAIWVASGSICYTQREAELKVVSTNCVLKALGSRSGLTQSPGLRSGTASHLCNQLWRRPCWLTRWASSHARRLGRRHDAVLCLGGCWRGPAGRQDDIGHSDRRRAAMDAAENTGPKDKHAGAWFGDS